MKRRSRRTAVVAGLISLTLLGAATAWAAVDTPWSQSDADAAHSRTNSTETILTAANVSKAIYLRSIVSRPVDVSPGIYGCETGMIPIAPVISGGRIYAVVSDHLKAFDLTTGNVVWDRAVDPASSTIYRTLSISGSRILLGTADCVSSSDPGGGVFAFSLATGTPLWTHGFSSGGLNQVVTSGSYVVVTAPGAISASSFIEVLNVATGGVVWSRPDCEQTSTPALVVAGKVLYPTAMPTAVGFTPLWQPRHWRRVSSAGSVQASSPPRPGTLTWPRRRITYTYRRAAAWPTSIPCRGPRATRFPARP